LACGSIAGTGLQTTFSRLAAPTGKAQAALKELGVSVADATGKMRPAEVVLSDIYKSIKKYGDTDQLSFFKDIAGEEAAKSFQALLDRLVAVSCKTPCRFARLSG
jgi:TP901 family phage tail tape measure protein